MQYLFDGKTLEGWVQRGGNAVYKVEDGAIVGTTATDTPNSFLCTKESFDDFIMELDFKVDPALNSGVQIRSNSYESFQNGRVHGYQVEIDPSDRAWTGGIYDESRRGWLYDLKDNEPARKAFKQNQWNHFRIEAVGHSIKTFLNGVPAADLVDSLTPVGFIALQVHSTKSEKPLRVMWRNIRLLDMSRSNKGSRPEPDCLRDVLPNSGDLPVWFTPGENKISVNVNGKLFTEYNFNKVPRPYFYPVIGPSGGNVTRHWPMKEAANESHDHSHHRSVWFTHGEVNGHDCWSEAKTAGKIVHDKFLKIESFPTGGVIKSRNRWLANNGEIVCTDTRTHTFYSDSQGIIMDFEVAIHASQGQVVLGDTKEGSMAVRLAPTMRLKGEVAQGNIVNSEGVCDGQTWGKRAAWCDYYGPVNGQVVGVAIFDHPENPRHPTWWHVRDYGLFTANPFGIHNFEDKPKGIGDLVIPAGKSMNFRYRLFFHKGDEKQAGIALKYKEYTIK